MNVGWSLMFELLIPFSCFFCSILAANSCVKRREEKSLRSMPVPRGETQVSFSAASSSSSSDAHINKNTNKVVDGSEPKKIEKSEKVAEMSQEKATKKSSEEKFDVKVNHEKKACSLERPQITRTDATQDDIMKDEDVKKRNKSLQKPVILERTKSASFKQFPLESEKTHDSARNRLALLNAAEQMAMDKGDYDDFGPPVRSTKRT
ncbi:unnamed protein product [Haemonchus placei]|uniref:Organ specific protein n=1 Tax=Haemonchus placei TaxID=6290 RepID=A0A0N4WXC2_HAEPC|nr:unnamed protein product [Haemonchus placei]